MHLLLGSNLSGMKIYVYKKYLQNDSINMKSCNRKILTYDDRNQLDQWRLGVIELTRRSWGDFVLGGTEHFLIWLKTALINYLAVSVDQMFRMAWLGYLLRVLECWIKVSAGLNFHLEVLGKNILTNLFILWTEFNSLML